MDKAEGGRRKTRTLLSYNLRNLDKSNCCVISNSIQLQKIRKAGVKIKSPAPLFLAPSLVIHCLNQVMEMLALPSK